MKLLQELKDDVLLLLAERKVDMNVMSTDQPGSAASGNVDVRTNEQNDNNRVRTTRFKDEIRTYVFCCVQTLRFVDVCVVERQGKGRGRGMGHGDTILQCLPRNSDEGTGTTTESQGQVSCPARGRLANIGIAKAITGGKRPGPQRLGKGCHGRAQPPRPPMERASCEGVSSTPIFLPSTLIPRTHRPINSIPLSTPPFYQPVSWKQT